MKLLPDNLNKLTGYLFLVLILLLAIPAECQIDEDPPISPVFRLLTINQVTGNTEMTWSSSPSADVAGYVIYVFQNGEGYAFDTIFNPNAAFYSVLRPGTSYFSESFVIAALDTAGNISPLSNELNTIFTESGIDTCNKKITVSWNNYPSAPVKVSGYDILVSVNGGIFNLAGHVPDNVNSFIIDEFTNGSQYCFLVKALLENGLFSLSNRSYLTARIQTPPQWINADYATVNSSNEIDLQFTVDHASEIRQFKLERKAGPSGTFQQIAILPATNNGDDKITYTDKTADPNVINFYRLSGINNCNLSSGLSNIASNIVLNVTAKDSEIRLTWNKYRNWLGNISEYRLFMDTGSGFNESAVINPSDTVYSQNIPAIMYTLKEGKVCFYVKAFESLNPYGISGESISQQTCFSIDEIITVPNVFTPDGDTRNDLFKPVITFMPSEYQLIISNRQEKILFETRDFMEAWNGTDNGEPLPEGVYLWFLKLTSSSGKTYTRTGTITLFKNR